MKAVFVHLSGSRRGKTEVFSSDKITIGADASNEIAFDAKKDTNISAFHAEILRKECGYLLIDKGSLKGTLVNHRVLSEMALKDGDLIEFGAGGPTVRFRIKIDEDDICKPWSEILEDSLGVAIASKKGRFNTATGFFKQLLCEVYTQTSHHIKLRIILTLVVFSGIVIAYFFVQNIKLTQTVEKVKMLELERSIAENIIKKYTNGVCLIQGAFSYYDEETGDPLFMMGRMSGINEYTGTGFLVSAEGLIITNRHIAEPWWELDAFPESQLDPRVKPKFVVFRAFFPGNKEPFPLTVEKVSEEVDVALLRIDTGGINIPVHELDTTDKGAVVGEPILLLGYPAGIKAIFAKMDPELVRQFIHIPFIQLVQELSNFGFIKPLATQGHLSDIMKNRLVYDAQTTVGGSGGPIFNKKGQVIGINYGIFPGFRGSNFGVPIRYGLALLKEVSKSVKDKKK
ncbi:MAG: trypsin-like peptidase domain-containing protein [Candidatus Kuenenia sp.]|nr:trypsin-like peptidase domain-containing protein [Candidatus Kuenenia sp.]